MHVALQRPAFGIKTWIKQGISAPRGSVRREESRPDHPDRPRAGQSFDRLLLGSARGVWGIGAGLGDLRNGHEIRLCRRQGNDGVAHIGWRNRARSQLGDTPGVALDSQALKVASSRYLKAAGRSL